MAVTIRPADVVSRTGRGAVRSLLHARGFIVAFALAGAWCSSAQVSPDNPLLSTLVARLGISTSQAGSGVGAVLAMARDNLAAQDYEVIAAAVPDAGPLAEAAKMQGVVTRPIDDRDDLAAVLDGIGIPAESARNFVPVMRAWLTSQGAPEAGDLVAGVM